MSLACAAPAADDLRARPRDALTPDHAAVDAAYGALDLTRAGDLARFVAAHRPALAAPEARVEAPTKDDHEPRHLPPAALRDLLRRLDGDAAALGLRPARAPRARGARDPRVRRRPRGAGLEADLTIRVRHAKPAPEGRPDGGGPAHEGDAARHDDARVDGAALVVEDNLIIAMDAVDALEALGAAPVHMASGVAAALEILRREPVALGLLDVNLGVETSAEVARVMAERGVPFALATGYGEGDLTGAYPEAPVLKKPYDDAALRRVIGRLMGRRGADG